MSRREEILFLAHRIPYPPDKGDKIRSWRLLNHLSNRFDVHLAAFVDDPADFTHEPFLNGVCASVYLEALNPLRARIKSVAGLVLGEPLSVVYFRSAAMARRVRALRERGLVAEIAFSSSMAPYVEEKRSDRPRLVDFCDADSEKWRDYAAARRGPMRLVYYREARTLAKEETRILRWADAAFAVNSTEANLLNRGCAQKKAIVLGNGVDAEYFSPERGRAPPLDKADVVFVGAMDYAANIDAAVWFTREAWPSIRAAAPAARFSIIGPRPASAVRKLSTVDGVQITGRVEDIRPHLQHARAVVAPLRIARGVPNKVLEAMAMARPVVATSPANAGIGAVAGEEILIADEPSSFANAVVGLLKEKSRGDAIGASARARVLADFQWEKQLETFDQVLRAARAP